MQNIASYPNFGRFSQTLGVNAKILGLYTLGTHFSWGYPNFVDLPKMCYLDVFIQKKMNEINDDGVVSLLACLLHLLYERWIFLRLSSLRHKQQRTKAKSFSLALACCVRGLSSSLILSSVVGRTFCWRCADVTNYCKETPNNNGSCLP